jgi:hypothetical protein
VCRRTALRSRALAKKSANSSTSSRPDPGAPPCAPQVRLPGVRGGMWQIASICRPSHCRRATPAPLLAYVATAKYQDACRSTARSRSSSDWAWICPQHAGPLDGADERAARAAGRAPARHICKRELIHMDETTVQVNTEPGRTASSTSYMWVSAAGRPASRWCCSTTIPAARARCPRVCWGLWRHPAHRRLRGLCPGRAR